MKTEACFFNRKNS